jgi:ABC-2 type transport system permease protein
MKTMISRPYGRSQILSAKLAATLLYGLEMLVGTFLFVSLCTGIFFRFDGIGAKELMWTGGSIVNIPGVVKALAIYGLDFVQIIVYLVMAFAIAAIFRSRALATGISLFLLLVGSSIAQVLAVYFSWGKYILFCNTSLSTYITYGRLYPGTSLGFSLIVSAVYTAVFLFLGYFVFAKRDI